MHNITHTDRLKSGSSDGTLYCIFAGAIISPRCNDAECCLGSVLHKKSEVMSWSCEESANYELHETCHSVTFYLMKKLIF